MSNVTRAEEVALLEASSGKTAYTNPTAPVKLKLVTANGSDTAAGTEVTGGSYAAQTLAFASGVAGAPSTIATSGPLTYVNMPAATVVGVEETDAAAVRRWFGPLGVSKNTNAGDTLTIGTGQYSKSFG